MRVALFVMTSLCLLATAGELTVTVPFDGSTVNLSREGIYDGVSADGLPYIAYEGAPCLPIMPVRVALPTGCRATGIEVTDAEYSELTGCYDVMPASEPVPLSAPAEYVQAAPDPGIYSLSEYYPRRVATLHGSSVWWGLPLAYLVVNPVRWNPSSRQLQVMESATIRVTYEEDPSVLLVSRRSGGSENLAMEIAARLVANPEGVSPSGAELVRSRDLEYGQYVIITHPDYEGAAQELADWKTAKGVPTGVYTTTWVNANYTGADLGQRMRAFLTDCRDEGADYVLIFGDDDRVACKDVKLVGSSSYSTVAPSDLYFADINDTAPGADLWNRNGNGTWGEVPYPYQYPQPSGYDLVDYHPDLWVGRASVNSTSEAELFVDKVLCYEGVGTMDYFETAPREMRIGYSTGILWYNPYIPGSADAEAISAHVPAGWEEEKLYESGGTNSATLTRQMIDAGPHHVFHASHGSQTYMWTSQNSNYTTSHIMAQTNIQDGGLPALWQSIACNIGQLDGYECCGDAWLASPQGGGFGCFNSRYGFGNFSGPCTGPSEMLCIRFYIDHWDNDIYNLGIAHGTSMDYYVPPCSTYMDWCMKEYNLFGDPELPIWTQVPSELDVDHPSTIGCAQSVTVSVQDGSGPVAGARVCMQKGDWQTGEVYEVEYTDASGEVDVFLDPGTPGDIEVAVWAHDYETYQGTIEVTGVGVEESTSGVPQAAVGPVAPNPATGPVALSLETPERGRVSVEVFDVAGRLVATVHDGVLGSGPHSLVWDLAGGTGSRVPAGVYHLRFSAPGIAATRRLMVIR